jgi:Holliday junction resolvase RusA-like endonuclease
MVPIAWQRVVRNGNKTYNNQRKSEVSFGLFLSQQHNDEPLFDKPIHIDATFYMPYPKAWKEEEKNFLYNVNPPYLESIYEFLLDSMKDVVIKNSHIICSLSVKKVYDKEPRTELVITEVK